MMVRLMMVRGYPGSYPRSCRFVPASLVALLLLLASSSAGAFPPYMNTWENTYPDSQSGANVEDGTGASCQLCHAEDNGGEPWNAYGWALRDFMDQGSSLAEALALAEVLDSDADPTASNNLTEIDLDTQPGWTPGPNNTFYFEDGSETPGQLPPNAILGDLDPPGAEAFIRGDANGDAVFDGLIDGLFILAYQFTGGATPPCLESADVDSDGLLNGLTDGLYALIHQFSGGPPPPAPYPTCGADPDPGGSLGCAAPPC